MKRIRSRRWYRPSHYGHCEGAYAIGRGRASFVLWPIIYLVQIGLRYTGRFNGQTMSRPRIKQNKNDTSIRQLLGNSVFYIQMFKRRVNILAGRMEERGNSDGKAEKSAARVSRLITYSRNKHLYVVNAVTVLYVSYSKTLKKLGHLITINNRYR
jgi:hypothetical protein